MNAQKLKIGTREKARNRKRMSVDTDVQVSSYLKTANVGIRRKRFVWFVKLW